MTIRTILLVAAMAISAQAVAEESEKQAVPEEVAAKPMSYCEQLGNTAGFEGEDLKSFIEECKESHKDDGAKGSAE